MFHLSLDHPMTHFLNHFSLVLYVGCCEWFWISAWECNLPQYVIDMCTQILNSQENSIFFSINIFKWVIFSDLDTLMWQIAPAANYRSIVVIRKTNQAWKTQNSSNVLVGNFEIFINSHHECFDNHLLMMIYCGNLIHWQVIFKVGQNSKKFFYVKKSSNEQRLRLI